jgi:hypothetical protein
MLPEMVGWERLKVRLWFRGDNFSLGVTVNLGGSRVWNLKIKGHRVKCIREMIPESRRLLGL